MSTTHFADAIGGMVEAIRRHRARTEPIRFHQALSRVIDQACDDVERVNLAGRSICPADVAALVQQLQELAGEDEVQPTTTAEAHDALFHLSAVLLGRPEAEDEADLEAGL